jgi:rare lipoprotein A
MMVRAGTAGFGPYRNTVSLIVLAALALSACDGGLSPREATRSGSVLELATPSGSRVVDRDVPAPQVFDLTESGLWDGRPSLGGVWVAHPTARDPERVIIRNTQTGAEVIGALFRRERENPGPRYQISSEAAAALGILAGQPATISVIALRVERTDPRPPSADQAVTDAAAPTQDDAQVGANVPDAETAAAQQPAPQRGLRDRFARQAPQSAAPGPEVVPTPVTPVIAPPMPTTGAQDRVEITSLDPEPAAPRRGLRAMFRRDTTGAPAATGITQTTLAPTAPLAATPLLANPGDDHTPGSPGAQLALSEPALASPAQPVAAAQPARRGLRDMFRRQPAETAAETAAEPTLIPLPAVASTPSVALPATVTQPTSAQPDRPFVQIGIFSVEANATRARAQMRAAGLPAEVRPGRAGDNQFWRVVIGPAPDAATHVDHLRRARGAGFTDAYAVVR